MIILIGAQMTIAVGKHCLFLLSAFHKTTTKSTNNYYDIIYYRNCSLLSDKWLCPVIYDSIYDVMIVMYIIQYEKLKENSQYIVTSSQIYLKF